MRCDLYLLGDVMFLPLNVTASHGHFVEYLWMENAVSLFAYVIDVGIFFE